MKIILKLTIYFLVMSSIALHLISCANNEQPQQVESTQVFTANVGESVNTMFFSFTVNSANTLDIYNDFVANDNDYKLILVNLTYTNIFSNDIEVADSDFVINYGQNNSESAWPYDAFVEEMMPLKESVAPNETKTYDLLFAVPKSESEFALNYTERYVNESLEQIEGNTYSVEFSIN